MICIIDCFMKKSYRYIIAGIILIACVTSCITVYVQKNNTNSSINTADTSENSADSASIDINIPSEVFE